MTQEPEKTEQTGPAERPEKPKPPRRDAAAWYPHILQCEAGTPAQEIADRLGVARDTVYQAATNLRRLSAAEFAAVRELALRRRRLAGEAEYLIGDPAAAIKMSNAYTALRRAEREERISEMETRNAVTPGENKEAKLSDAEVELLRADLHRRLVLCEPAQPERANPAGCQPGGGDRPQR